MKPASRGATVSVGGARPTDAALERGNFYLPTLIENAPLDSAIVKEEVLVSTAGVPLHGAGSSDRDRPTTPFTDSALDLDAQPGLGQSCHRATPGRNVWVNSLHYGHDELPFGGVKASGIGRDTAPKPDSTLSKKR